jgi:hypothetical protein
MERLNRLISEDHQKPKLWSPTKAPESRHLTNRRTPHALSLLESFATATDPRTHYEPEHGFAFRA